MELFIPHNYAEVRVTSNDSVSDDGKRRGVRVYCDQPERICLQTRMCTAKQLRYSTVSLSRTQALDIATRLKRFADTGE